MRQSKVASAELALHEIREVVDTMIVRADPAK
jgi:hypothetical protein